MKNPTTVIQQTKLQIQSLQPSAVPAPNIQELASESSMTVGAKQIFFQANPVIDTDRNLFNQHCKAPVSNNTVELGCYTSDNRIYLLNITDPQLHGEMVVTAAHEMLHAVYAQTSDSVKKSINAQLEEAVPVFNNPQLNQELAVYQVQEPGQKDNELHSLIGTEYAPLTSSLESYYAQFFTNRNVVVGYSVQFKQVFNQIDTQLTTLKGKISTTRSTLNALLIDQEYDKYNQLVPTFNSLVDEYNQDVARYNALSRSLMNGESTASTQ